MNLPARPPPVTPAIITLAHNANASLVGLYGELLTEQEKRMQMLTAQLTQAQQQCMQLTEACKVKDAKIVELEERSTALLARITHELARGGTEDDEPLPEAPHMPMTLEKRITLCRLCDVTGYCDQHATELAAKQTVVGSGG